MLSQAEPFISENMHPTVIIGAYLRALDDAIELLEKDISVPVDINDEAEMVKIVRSCIGTKLMKQWYVWWWCSPVAPARRRSIAWRGSSRCHAHPVLL
jgi:hypothetical protein